MLQKLLTIHQRYRVNQNLVLIVRERALINQILVKTFLIIMLIVGALLIGVANVELVGFFTLLSILFLHIGHHASEMLFRGALLPLVVFEDLFVEI